MMRRRGESSTKQLHPHYHYHHHPIVLTILEIIRIPKLVDSNPPSPSHLFVPTSPRVTLSLVKRAMKLTADLINSSASYINTLKDRELDLRGKETPHLEEEAHSLHPLTHSHSLTHSLSPTHHHYHPFFPH